MKMSFTAVGDAIIQRHMPFGGYPGFKPVQQFLAKGDTRFFNLETTLHHYESYGSQYSGGGYLCGPPEVLQDIKKFGFNVASFANNHTLDYSYDGMAITLKNVAQAGLPCAGAGLNLQEASQPVYYESPTGRVAVIAATSTFNPAAMAGRASSYLPGRPGLNPLRFETTYYVTSDQAKNLKQVIEQTHIDDENKFLRANGFAPPVPKDTLTLGNYNFKVANKTGHTTKVLKKDLTRFKKLILEAKAQAEYVLISLHCHEMQDMSRESLPNFLQEFAHKCIDYGADALVGHGPHAIRGLEIYKEKPIFYSLGDFILNIQDLKKAPADYFESFDLSPDATISELFEAQWARNTRGMHVDPKLYEAVIPFWQTQDGKLTELTLAPVELGFTYFSS
ncbi:CapA family protein [Ligilactobacillus acidipiscis]|uniref:CapA family protein n=1 Tax=Ligilactobacillus acidipiscis TaxID=89059 RepID=UPI0023F94228|nr:CapA family protein [Ligilactobacillus acidipiscis]WEV58210.1 CapA family protein [Ligilactobacillus acidipiscis]